MILFIRHLESKKNIRGQFSSKNDNESLTCESIDKGRKLANNVFEFAQKHDLAVGAIYCANSRRAIESAMFIAKKFDVEICACDELKSNLSGSLLGKTEEEAKHINPTFMHQLNLFRAGIFSSYDFVKVSKREDKHDFEKRVNNCIENILANGEETLKIIVLHHSSLTAAVINFARKLYSYPSDFYGHVACGLGRIYLIHDNEILLCDEPADSLLGVDI